MPETETIQVMGRGANVDFTIDDTVPYETAVQGLRSYLSECNGLYSRGTVSVNVGRRILEAAELSGIKRILDQESGLTVSRYWCAPEIIEEALNSPPKAAVLNGDGGQELDEALAPEDGAPAGARRGSARNGVKAADGSAVQPGTAAKAGQQLALLTEVAVNGAVTADGVAAAVEPEGATGAAAKESELAAVVADSAARESASEAVVDEPAAPAAATDPTAGADDKAAVAEPEALAAAVDPAGDDDGVVAERAAGELPVSVQRGAPALIVKTTCRSGEVIRYPGDVVALADVNPGAEIIADGDIVVFGALRGLAHAGAAGDLKATIIALNLESHRVQIGPHIGEAPARVRRSKSPRRTPQVAYVRRRSVFVAPFTRRQEEYQGGILYEG